MMVKTRVAALMAAICLSIVCMGAENPFQRSFKSSSGSTRKNQEDRLEALEKQNAALRKQVVELSMKLELLTERVNTMCGVPGGAAVSGVDALVSGPPTQVPGLTTVRLMPESQPPSKPKGRLFISRQDEDSAVLIEHGAPLPGTNYVPLPDPETGLIIHGSGKEAPAAKSSPESNSSASTLATINPGLNFSGTGKSPDEASAYREIKELFESGKAEESRPLMEDYLKQHSGSAHEDEVAYWLGEHYFSQGEHKRAVEVLKVVTERHPESEAAPEALYKVGLSYLEMGLTDEAEEALSEVRILYPFSKAAEKAEQKILSCCR